MSDNKNILVIEDDENIAELLKIHLGDLGYKVVSAADGLQGLATFEKEDFAMVILDLMLPGLDGIEVCKRIREKSKYIPILMLTSRSEELDKVLGLEVGADDYITKPFSIREFIARVKATFRRIEADDERNKGDQQQSLSFGDLRIEVEKRKVTLAGSPIELTAKEFDLLHVFATHPGRAFSRQQLLDLVWGYQFDGYEHTVNSHINRLRSKIEPDVSDVRYIKTVWGIGYSFVEPDELVNE